MEYFHKGTKWYGIRPFSRKQSHVVTELSHYLLHLSWDEEPEETREYHDNKTMAVLYPSIVLFMIADKLTLPEEAILSRMTTLDNGSSEENADSYTCTNECTTPTQKIIELSQCTNMTQMHLPHSTCPQHAYMDGATGPFSICVS